MRFRWAFVALTLAGSVAAARQDQPSRVYVAVLDDAGKPDLTMGLDNFLIWEGGTARRVTAAALSPQPLSVVVIAFGIVRADTQGGRAAIKAAISEFQRVPGTRLGVTTDPKAPKIEPVESSAPAMDSLVTHFVGSGPGLLIFEAVEQASKLLAKEKSDRRAILIIADATRVDPDTGKNLQPVVDTVKKSGVSVWVTDFVPDFASTRPQVYIRKNSEQEQLMNGFTYATGGSSNRIVGTTALPEGVASMARVMLSQYSVDYERPAGSKPADVRVGVRIPVGWKILAPQWPLR